MSERLELDGRTKLSGFEEFFAGSERPVRFALSARFGFEGGREAAAEALAYAWEHWDRISVMENPAGYVYRVGHRVGVRTTKKVQPVDFSRPASEDSSFEPKLPSALSDLSHRQRTVVVLVHGLGWTQQETADFLGLSTSTIQKHLERGLEKLRRVLGVHVES